MRKQIAQNKRNTYLIMLVFVVIIAAIGWIISALANNYEILIWMVVASLAYTLLQYFIGVYQNISGMYFNWEYEEDVTVHHCYGKISQAQCGSEDWVERVLWYDLVPGIAGSLSVRTIELDGLDLTAVAEQVYLPAQGDA